MFNNIFGLGGSDGARAPPVSAETIHEVGEKNYITKIASFFQKDMLKTIKIVPISTMFSKSNYKIQSILPTSK